MAIFSPAGHDTMIAGFSVVVTCVVLATIRQMLSLYRDAAVISPSENKPQYITQEVEDSLKSSTLEKLLDSPSWIIRDTTSTIICERALHDEATFAAILHCVSSADYNTREKGIRVLNLMINNGQYCNLSLDSTLTHRIVNIGVLHRPQGYMALVKCLKYCVTDYEHNYYDSDWDNWPFRDIVEQLALSLLIQLIGKFGINRLLKYRFVDDWLVKEPWGLTTSGRHTNFIEFLQENNQKLNEIVNPIFLDLAGRKQLVKNKLIIPEISSSSNNSQAPPAEYMVGDDFVGILDEPGRMRDQNSTDENMRRRNREAMVLNDGSRPLGREDIIHLER